MMLPTQKAALRLALLCTTALVVPLGRLGIPQVTAGHRASISHATPPGHAFS